LPRRAARESLRRPLLEVPRRSERRRYGALRWAAAHERPRRSWRRKRRLRRVPRSRRRRLAIDGRPRLAPRADARGADRLRDLPRRTDCGLVARASRWKGRDSIFRARSRSGVVAELGWHVLHRGRLSRREPSRRASGGASLDRHFRRAARMRRVPWHPPDAAHGIDVVRSVDLPRHRGDAPGRRARYFRNRQDSSCQRRHRRGDTVSSFHPTRCDGSRGSCLASPPARPAAVALKFETRDSPSRPLPRVDGFGDSRGSCPCR